MVYKLARSDLSKCLTSHMSKSVQRLLYNETCKIVSEVFVICKGSFPRWRVCSCARKSRLNRSGRMLITAIIPSSGTLIFSVVSSQFGNDHLSRFFHHPKRASDEKAQPKLYFLERISSRDFLFFSRKNCKFLEK